MLPATTIKKYRDIARIYGVELTLEQARADGERLILFYEGLFKPSEAENSAKCDETVQKM